MENVSKFIVEKDILHIIKKYGYKESVIEKYSVRNASDQMLGFLSDYWKLKVQISPNKKVLCFFIKAISRSNKAKADMVREMKLYDKELYFYSVIKEDIELPDLKPWSAKLVTALDDAMVFEDLNVLEYECRNKFQRFDMPHTLLALKALARFHASSLVYEERRSRELQRSYRIPESHRPHLNRGGYYSSSPWFVQCREGALEAIRSFSNYSDKELSWIENRWNSLWNSTLSYSDTSSEYRNVLCHRDLWNNNILFHYKEVKENHVEPDDCVMVDFQAVRYQPPAGDVMLLLYCNLDPELREQKMQVFLNYYIDELHMILLKYNVVAQQIISKQDFFKSAEEQRQWALVVLACLMPQIWIDDDLTTKTFCDTEQFDEILSKDKASFIKKMMQTNDDYRQKVMEVFEEIVTRYSLHQEPVRMS